MDFTVIDPKTGGYPDLENIVLHEEWAKGLVYCDMEGFAIQEDGSLVLMDQCGGFRYCPDGCFEVVLDEPNEPLTLEQLREMDEVPIYVVTEKRGKGWCILSWHGVNKSFTFFSKTGTSEGMTAVPLSASTYGDRWLAYRRPPENDTESPFENNKSKFMEE